MRRDSGRSARRRHRVSFWRSTPLPRNRFPLKRGVNKDCRYFRFSLFTKIKGRAIFATLSRAKELKMSTIPGKKLSLGRFSAFVPTPLPPKFEWTPKLVRLLSDADRLIGKLAGEAARLPNPHILMRPFARREAVLSSRIEGTQATLGELLAAEAGAIVDRSPDDLREVGNYVVALEHGISRLKKLPICVRLIKELHTKLMTGVRGHHASRGEFRRIQNWIGKPGCTPETASYVPPPPNEVEPSLAAWEKFLHESDLPPLVTIALAHYQFEAIHPFLDGNGRVGRLLITLFFIERNILPTPSLYLSAFFEASRRDYYECLNGISERGAWDEWLEYFLLGIARTSEDALNRSGRLNATLDEWKNSVAGDSTKNPFRVVELLAANPFLTVKTAAEKLNVAFTTAQRAIRRLENMGIVVQVGAAKRDRVYCAKELLKILEEPALLAAKRQ
jgi:Fic family protein